MNPQSDRNRPTDGLLRELNAKISTMETLLGNLHSTESRNGTKFSTLKVELRTRLTACYLAKDSLRQGEFAELRSLDDLLLRLRIRIEHRKFRTFGNLLGEDVKGCDLDELCRKLGETG